MDTKFNITAFADVCRDYFHQEPVQADLELAYGMTAHHAIRHMGVPEEDVPAVEAAWGKTICTLAKTHSRLYDGIWPVMCAMRDAGILLGINTSRRMDEVAPLRTYIAEPFLDLCQIIVTCDQIDHPKPAPDSLLFFMEQTGLTREQVLFVGDSTFDSGCAEQAGCDFALAVWGAFQPASFSVTYKPEQPADLLDILGIVA